MKEKENQKKLSLSEYAAFARMYVNCDIKGIRDNGSYYISTNNTTYVDVEDYLSDVIIQLVLELNNGNVERDISMVEALHISGIVNYLMDRNYEPT